MSTEKPATAAEATATRYAVSAVASLIRLSPARITTSRRGSPTVRPTAVAATASGGDTIAPSAKAAASGMSGTTAYTARPTAAVVNSTSPTDSSPIARRFCRKLITELCQAAANSSGGRIR